MYEMTSKTDELGARIPSGRYDLPAGNYEVVETDTAAGPSSRRVTAAYRPAYLSEDETVLACCHHAHEVAKAHGAKEVMLEHLAHALARVPEAANVLQDRGINVESLKRESAAVISSEIPVENTTIVAQLRASKDFNTVMHLAAAAASRRDERMLGVRDLLDALLRFDPKSRVARMIKRNAIDGDLDLPRDPVDEVRGLLERYANEARDLRLAVSDMRSNQYGQTSAAVGLIEDRMRGVERTISAVASDISAERASLGDHRADVRTILDRLQMMERGIPGGSTQLQTLVGDRFLSIQKTIDNQRTDLARIENGVTERLKGIERLIETRDPGIQLGSGQTDVLSTRIGALEMALESKLNEASKVQSTLIDRLKTFELFLQSRPAVPQGLEGLADRLTAIEKQMGEQRTEMRSWQERAGKDMKALEGLLAITPTAAASGGSTEHLQALQRTLENNRNETQRIEASISERHRAFERLLDTKLGPLAGIASLADRLTGVERTLAAQRADQSSIRSALDGELEQIRKAMLSLGNAQQTLSTAIDEWRQNNGGDLSVISNRLAGLERSAAATTERMNAQADRLAHLTVPVALPNAPVVQAVPTNGAPASQPSPVPTQTIQSGGLLDRVDRALANRYNS
jgi:DNA repair exonuclease SbcCD ATPase subunit